MDLARAVAPDCEHKTIGIRPGEKIYEMMISQDDARRTLEFEDYYVIEPAAKDWWDAEEKSELARGTPCASDFEYSSESNDRWLSVEDLRELARDVEGYP